MAVCSGLPGTVPAYAGYPIIIVSALICVLVSMCGDCGASPSQSPSQLRVPRVPDMLWCKWRGQGSDH